MFDDMVEFLDSTYVLKDQLVPCLVGPVGIGKTAAVLKHAENIKANNVVTIIASQILPNEVSGITMPDASTKAMEIYDHFRLSSLKDGDILFFDELLEADQMVLSACLTLIESRQMMSGRKLPDIQIIAATNPTIKPSMLKENIRQRFLFRSFELDRGGTRDFIYEDCGIDVTDLMRYMEESSNEYNILSPRSLTKMARWMATAEDEAEASSIARQIDLIWKSGIGSTLYSARFKKDPELEARMALKHASTDAGLETVGVDWKNDSMKDLMDMLMATPEWEEIKKTLENQQMRSDNKDDKEIVF